MPSTTTVNLSEGYLNSWIHVYNECLSIDSESQKLTLNSMRGLISENKIIPDYSYLTFTNKRPSAVGRIELQDGRSATLTDFAIAYNRESGGANLISHILRFLRVEGIAELKTWLHPSYLLTSEVLETFLFEPARLRSHIVCNQMLPDEIPYVSPSYRIIEGASNNVIVPIPRTINAGIQQMIYDGKKGWIFDSRISIEGHVIDCYQSSITRGEGWVDLKLCTTRDSDDAELSIQLISLAVRRLQKRGVKVIHADIDSSSDIFSLFKANGFTKKITFLEMLFTIEH